MIYINARFLNQNLTGVQRFALELSRNLCIIRKDIILLTPDKNLVLDKNILKEIPVKEVKGGYGYFWEQVTLVNFLKKNHNPLLINLCNTAPILYKNKISVIHDITFLRYPESYSINFRYFYKFFIPLIIKTSRKIITVSEYSIQDISKEYNLSNNSIDYIYNGVNSNFMPSSSLHLKNHENYALCVSSPNKHKNFSRLIQAFLKTNINCNLKIIGSLANAFNNSDLMNIDDPRIKFLGRVSDEELIELYQNADFFIFPSLYEGFGIPPLEAQACGCPVISSNAASLPEVLEDSVVYFNPLDIEEMTLKIESIFNNNVLKQQLKQKGFQNIRRFSWNKSALKLNQIIEDFE